MADMIQSEEDPVRAIFVIAGNRLLSIGGGTRIQEAFESLNLLVSPDSYRNATGEVADWVLPAADGFEREDLNYFVQGPSACPTSNGQTQWLRLRQSAGPTGGSFSESCERWGRRRFWTFRVAT